MQAPPISQSQKGSGESVITEQPTTMGPPDSIVTMSNSTMPNRKLSNIVPKGATSPLNNRAVKSRISTSSAGSRPISKSSNSESGVTASTLSKVSNSKASHGFSNSIKKLRHQSNGGSAVQPKLSDVSASSAIPEKRNQFNTIGTELPKSCTDSGLRQGSHGLLFDANAQQSNAQDSTSISQSTRLHFSNFGDAINQPMLAKNEGVTISDLQSQLKSGLVVLPPERPPKPAHLAIAKLNNTDCNNETLQRLGYSHSSENYANAADMQELYISEQNNNINGDVHRSQPCQNVDNPNHDVQQAHIRDNSHHHAIGTHTRNAQSLKTECPAPMVSRGLKPNRQNISSRNRSQTIGGNMITSYSSASAVGSHEASKGQEGSLYNLSKAHQVHSNFATLGPPVVRALKPANSDVLERRNRFNSVDLAMFDTNEQVIEGQYDSSRRNSIEEEQIYYYMPPINTTTGLGGVHSSKPPPLMIPATSFEHPSIAYIDLDLPLTTSPTTKSNAVNSDFATLNVLDNSRMDKHENR